MKYVIPYMLVGFGSFLVGAELFIGFALVGAGAYMVVNLVDMDKVNVRK